MLDVTAPGSVGSIDAFGLVGAVGCLGQRVLKGLEDHVGAHVGRHAPADDHPGERVHDETDMGPAGPGRAIGQVCHPRPVRAVGGEVALDEVRREAWNQARREGGDRALAAPGRPAKEALVRVSPATPRPGGDGPMSPRP